MWKRLSPILIVAVLVCLTSTGMALASEPIHWSYEGDTGPAYWGALDPAFATCSTGKEQSPTNIPADALLNAGALDQKYEPTPLTIVNNGHTIEVEYEPGSALTVGGVPFSLSQFHLHSASEHTLADQRYPMELHLVHKAADGRLAVIGLLVTAGAENPAWKPILDNMPAEEGAPQDIAGVSVNAADLLPAGESYYRYDGSLTTPPCSQGVNWFVMKSPVELSQAQIDQFRAIYTDNYRPVQPLNGRTFLAASAPLASPEPAQLPLSGGLPLDLLVLVGGLALACAGGCLGRGSRSQSGARQNPRDLN